MKLINKASICLTIASCTLSYQKINESKLIKQKCIFMRFPCVVKIAEFFPDSSQTCTEIQLNLI